MSNVTSINRHQRALTAGQPNMSSAHRAALAQIQDLAATVSLETSFAVSVAYSGNCHEIDVSLRRYALLELGNYGTDWHRHVYLPPNPNADDDCLQQLGEIVEHLESLLPSAGGAA